MLKEGGEEMVKSLMKIFNKIMIEEKTPEEWEEMIVKSVHKKGKREDIKNRRGLFLTNIISKVFEKALMERMEVNTSIFQNGGKKERSVKDNWIAIMAVIDSNKRKNENTTILFADAEKCFDQLWLEDCLIDLHEAGMREREIHVLLEMNKTARMKISTPYGKTEEIHLEKIVKQGTVYGPQLCCASTDKINSVGTAHPVVVSPGVEIKNLIYVDDIAAVGNKEMVEEAGKNLKIMEDQKGFVFNTEKTNYINIRTGREKEEEVIINVTKGRIEKKEEYKYLGNWITTNGTVEKQLEVIENKMEGMIKEVMRLGKEEELGVYAVQARLLMYERTIVPTMTFNLEVWTKLRESDWKRLEKMQAKALKRILMLPISTPYWGILQQTGIWPIRERINYHRLMLYENLMTSDNERLGKVVVMGQRHVGGTNWLSETEKTAKRLGMTLKVEEMTKEQWKKKVKGKTEGEIEKQWKEKREMKKLRHVREQRFQRQEYLDNSKPKEASEYLKIKLEMKDIGKNLGNKRQCTCGKEETIEHVIECKEVKRRMTDSISLEDIKSPEKARIEKARRWIEAYISSRDGVEKQNEKERKEEIRQNKRRKGDKKKAELARKIEGNTENNKKKKNQ